MPELSELEKLFEQAKALVDFNDEAAKNAAMEALKKSLQPLYQSISNLGFGAAQAKFTKEVTDAKAAQQTAETALTTERTAHQTQIRDLQDKAPDVKTVNQQWETKLEEARQEHLKEQKKLKDRVRNVLLQRDQEQLASELEELGVPKSTSKILAKDPDLLPARGDYDADTGTLSVRQAGQQIPLAPASGQTLLRLVAEEVIARPEVKVILESKGDSGSGVTGGSQPGKGDAAFYDGLRKTVKDGSTEGLPTKPLRERVQGR